MPTDGFQIQFNALKEENNRLKSQLYSIQMEKSSLQKRLDYLLKDLQQSAFHQHFQFLQVYSFFLKLFFTEFLAKRIDR